MYGIAGNLCKESIGDEFVALLKKKASEITVGYAYNPKKVLGPVISAAHKQKVTEWIEKGVAEGAELVLDDRSTVVSGYENGFFPRSYHFRSCEAGNVHR